MSTVNTYRIPGIIYSLDYGLFLRFQVNPTDLSVTKTNRFSTIPVQGWQDPVIIWSSGDFKTISFPLYFDSRYNRTPAPSPGIGVRDVQAVLESFLYPQPKASFSSSLTQLVQTAKSTPEVYTPPPQAKLVFGPQWWQGYLNVSTMKVGNLDPTLTPQSLECSVTMTVVSAGTFFTTESQTRRFLATVVYPLNQSAGILSDAVSAVGGVIQTSLNSASATANRITSIIS